MSIDPSPHDAATADEAQTLEVPESSKRSAVTRVIGFVVAGALLVLPLLLSDLQLRRQTELIVLVLAVVGVNLLTGYTGLISLGHGVFVGIGAFTMANILDYNVPILLALILAAAFTGIMGLLIGLPALRVRGLYLALITFGFALAFGPIARRLGKLTGGVSGRPVENDGFAPPSWLGINDQLISFRYYCCLLVVVAWFVAVRNLIGSRIGRAMLSIRDNETAAAQFGVPIVRVKAGVLAVSAAMAGTTGALQAIMNPYVTHSSFDAFLSLRLYAAAVLGGLASLLGSVLGVIALIVVPAFNNTFGLLDNDSIVFGLGLIIVTFVAPRGVAGLFRGDPLRNSDEV